MSIHILRSRNEPRPWWRADQRFDIPSDRKIFTDCCCCNMPAELVIVRLWTLELPIGGLGDYQERKLYPEQEPGFYIPYGDEPRWEVKCAPDAGCNVKLRKKCGADLRYAAHYGYE